ncbi:MAG TPA: aconitate hydratase, partial [Rhabdaerophilum sp.]|nr:aconitate hydratase [Rhabdaerophilum sp.]
KKGVVGRFVEFYGPGLDALSLADRATIANMAPEYGATCGFFPIDAETIRYMKFTGREDWRCEMVEAYAKAQGMWRDASTPDPVFTDTLGLDLSEVRPSLAGPRRPQDRVLLEDLSAGFEAELANSFKVGNAAKRVPVEGANYDIGHGDVVIAAITSCTNTSNPDVLVAAGLVAKKARAKGLDRKPWVKTSLAPGSQVVTDYLEKAGLQADLDAIGFDLVGYGCTTCIGNSGPLPAPISKAVNDGDIVAASVLSGNRNFEGRVSPDVRANYLASPPLVVAYALAGTVRKNLAKEPIGTGSDGQPVFLKDIWPTNHEVRSTVEASLDADMFKARYAHVFKGDAQWQAIDVTGGRTYSFSSVSTYVQNPPYFEGLSMTPKPLVDIVNARALAVFGDSITTDHISPAGSIKADSPAGTYLTEHQVSRADFNSYGSRRGNHEVMMRGTFANIRIKNFAVKDAEGNTPEGGYAIHYPSGEKMFIYDAAMRYEAEKVPLVVLAGIEYGNGSSRDWAAKGTALLGVKAVIAQSFERIHRSNLVGMGIVPFVFEEGTSWQTLGLKGDEMVSIDGLTSVQPRQKMKATITRADGTSFDVPILCRIDTLDEIEYFKNGGILHYVLRQLAA